MVGILFALALEHPTHREKVARSCDGGDPFEATAVQLLEQLVSTAKDKKRHNKWVDAALEELSRVDPNTYPVPKPERSTVIPSDTMTLPPPVEEVPEISAEVAKFSLHLPPLPASGSGSPDLRGSRAV